MSGGAHDEPPRTVSAELRLLGMPGEWLAELLDAVKGAARDVLAARLKSLPDEAEAAVRDVFRTHPALARVELPDGWLERVARHVREAVTALVEPAERLEVAAGRVRLDVAPTARAVTTRYFMAGAKSMQPPEAAEAPTARLMDVVEIVVSLERASEPPLAADGRALLDRFFDPLADHAAIDPEDGVEFPAVEGYGQRVLAAPVFPKVDHDVGRLKIRLVGHRISAPRP